MARDSISLFTELTMLYLVISDIHANLEALEAVLADAGPTDATLCLGDVVGYGADPNACVELVRILPDLSCLVGNHDCAALGTIDLNTFNPEARFAAEWTARQLTDENRQYLLTLSSKLEMSHFALAHASPRDPIWEYMVSPTQGPPNFAAFSGPLCLVGHTHVPRVFEEDDDGSSSKVWIPEFQESVALHEGPRRILNPGGVGQPRDGDPRAAYALYDSDSGEFQYRRVPYNFERAAKKIVRAGLPEILASRLSMGL
ncbi:MAG TPA: metallophosphoesterase family protein [Chloroflexota bacterium]